MTESSAFKINHRVGIFYPRFSIPKMKFLRQMLYGIQATKSVILNRIAAEIDEETTQKKIEDRLSHHLAHEVLWTRIHEAYPPRASVRAA